MHPRIESATPKAHILLRVISDKGECKMNVSAICEKCGDIAEAEYAALRHNVDTTDTHGTSVLRIVTVHCRACGTYQRPPHCQVDRVDSAMLRLLIL
jgi:RNase P subunit RPR2